MTPKTPEPGSFRHYLGNPGFNRHLAHAIILASDEQRARIAAVFPQAIAAWSCRDLWKAPTGFFQRSVDSYQQAPRPSE